MEPVLEIFDSEDEACLYLKHVQKESEDYLSRRIVLGESYDCQESFVPKSRIPQEFTLSLSTAQINSIISKFKIFKQSISNILTPQEAKRSKNYLKKLVFGSRPLLEVIKDLDQLTVWKMFKCFEEWIEEFEKFEEWVYCMLVLLEMPISNDVYSALNCIMIKAIQLSDRPSALVIIAIISEYFGQKLR